MMNTPMPMNSTLNHREKASIASRPLYRLSSWSQSMKIETTITAINPAMESQPSKFLRPSGSTRSITNTRKARPARANSGVSSSRFAVSDMAVYAPSPGIVGTLTLITRNIGSGHTPTKMMISTKAPATDFSSTPASDSPDQRTSGSPKKVRASRRRM